jgi:UDP-4-amino-4,6-dideoxy-N-acetyl-beta-L-altrosamine transaminase
LIAYGKQSISHDDISAVVDVLHSDFLTQGPVVPRFESALADNCKVNGAVSFNSATSALHVACLALELGPGDLAWTSPNSFVASANCVLYCGASVDFVDIDPFTYNISIPALEQKLATTKIIPKVLIVVHFAGQSAKMSEIYKLSKKFGFKIIEDASHALGGYYENCAVASCQYSDISVLSFHPVKIITTAEGGAATSNQQEVLEKMRLYRSHGVTRDPSLFERGIDEPWYYEQIALGFNYRMNDIQAALGLSQLKRLKDFITKREEIADWYNHQLQDLPIVLPRLDQGVLSSWHLYVVELAENYSQKDRSHLFKHMRTNGVGVNVHYIPIHLQPFYQRLGFEVGAFPVAENYYQRAMSLPIHPELTHDDLHHIVDTMRKYFD